MTQSSYAPETPAALPSGFDPRPQRLQPLRALKAFGRLRQNKEDTAQVFEIMRALSGNSAPKGYAKLLSSVSGGEIAAERIELLPILSDRAFLESLPAGSVGAAYLQFITRENISAEGLAAESRKDQAVEVDSRHPLAWYGRRLRDIHDLWHILSGYGRDPLGEACVVAFSYAQTKSLGFAFIALLGAINLGRFVKDQPYLKAVYEGWQRGRKCEWLPGEDYIRLLSEPLDQARARLNIGPKPVYDGVPGWAKDPKPMAPPSPALAN